MKNKKIFIFDAYGTLLDVDSACRKMMNNLGVDWENLSRIWRQKQLEYSWIRNSMDSYVDFWEITKHALNYAMKVNGIGNEKIKKNLLKFYSRPEIFKDALKFLENLQKRKIDTCILTNGNKEMIDKAIENSKLKYLIKKIYSVETCKKFKPSKEVYKLVLDGYNLEKKNFTFFSSNCWDIHGASNFGYRTVWINRGKNEDDILPGNVDFIITNLNEYNNYI